MLRPLLIALPLLAACQMPDATPDTCGADALRGLIGGPLPQTLPAPGPVRVYAQGDAVTMDFNDRRLNVILDAATRRTILALTCG